MEDVHQLKVFQAVAQHLSFTRAAQSLFLTQSAVSHQIAALERHFNTRLIVREGRTISLTEAGTVLLQHARRVFAVLEETEQAVRLAARPDMGRLRIGASPTACQYLIPESLREFRESYPSFSLAVSPGDSPVVAERLLEGAIDLGLLIRSDRIKQLAYHELFEDELGFIVSPLHPWARAGKVDRRQIGEQHYVLYSRNSATFRTIERYFAHLKLPLRDWTELGSMDAIKELVKLGLGISITAPWIARAELEQKSLVWLRMPGRRLTRTWCIACRSGRLLSIAEQTFIGLCQSVASQLIKIPG
jgi:LysR family transcriptional regulator, low CO2-responsive transcriptional regulator